MGKSRYSKAGLEWGEFYQIDDEEAAEAFATDGVYVEGVEAAPDLKHYVFFFRDHTFECLARNFVVRRRPPGRT